MLEWKFSYVFFCGALLLNQYKFIAFNIYWCKIFTIFYKILIIAVKSNETKRELIKYAKLCRNITTFNRQELASLFQVQEKIKSVREFKIKFF